MQVIATPMTTSRQRLGQSLTRVTPGRIAQNARVEANRGHGERIAKSLSTRLEYRIVYLSAIDKQMMSKRFKSEDE